MGKRAEYMAQAQREWAARKALPTGAEVRDARRVQRAIDGHLASPMQRVTRYGTDDPEAQARGDARYAQRRAHAEEVYVRDGGFLGTDHFRAYVSGWLSHARDRYTAAIRDAKRAGDAWAKACETLEQAELRLADASDRARPRAVALHLLAQDAEVLARQAWESAQREPARIRAEVDAFGASVITRATRSFATLKGVSAPHVVAGEIWGQACSRHGFGTAGDGPERATADGPFAAREYVPSDRIVSEDERERSRQERKRADQRGIARATGREVRIG